jgi:hypothetical protein
MHAELYLNLGAAVTNSYDVTLYLHRFASTAIALGV